MTVVATQTALVQQNSAVRLARYAAIINYPECNFFGVNNPAIDMAVECREIWSKNQRDMVAKYLGEAEFEIEQEIGYPISPRWIGQGQTQQYIDWQPFRPRLLTRFARFIEAGIEATSTISAGEAIDQTSDPATIGPVATTVTDVDEIKIYHPDSDVEIDPSSITISGGNVTIEVPRCRTVKESVADNPSTGLDYADLSNFESAVDLKRVYNDSSTEVVLAYPKDCTGCEETTFSGCIYVRNARLGIIDIQLSNTSNNLCRCNAQIAKLNYKAGMDVLTAQAEDAIVRLANSKMPEEPCGCDPVSFIWKRDREVPEVLTRERLNCPFGLSNGAWTAYQFAQSMKVMRGSTI